MPFVGQHVMDQSASIRVDERRNFSVEVGSKAVAHVDQHQTLRPVLRSGVRMKLIERSVKRLHCDHHIDI